MPNAGELNRRVSILERSTTRNAVGDLAETWNTLSTVWASIREQYSALTAGNSTFVSKATDLITLRWSRSLRVSPENRIQYVDPSTETTSIYVIESVVNSRMQNQFVMLLCYRLDGAL